MTVKEEPNVKPILLAPMAGVTDSPFRILCREKGCDLTYSEMISTKALYHGSGNTLEMFKKNPLEPAIGIQLFGRDPRLMADMVKRYINPRNDIATIDINMGCPVPKIVKGGEGSALMKDVRLAQEIVYEIKGVSNKPVTAKFRKGFTEEESNAVEFAKALQKAGADGVTVHGRTREQMYHGKADWNIIARVKDALEIPVIGNGDIFSGEDALRIFQETGCDGIMIARGAQGNPWIFEEIKAMVQGKGKRQIPYEEKVELSIKHYQLALRMYPEHRVVREMRKHIGWYLKGLPNAVYLKNTINTEVNPSVVIELLEQYRNNL